MQISHETIYRSLFIQARGVLKAELMKHLRTRRMMRRSKKASAKGQPRGQLIDAVSVRERPAEAEDRAIPGHWEGDLLTGSNNSLAAHSQAHLNRIALQLNQRPRKTLEFMTPADKLNAGIGVAFIG